MARTLVLNATGKVSAAVVDSLLEAGHEVVAASRHPQAETRRNLSRVRFDYADPSTYEAALDGVDRFFWLSPPLVLDGHGLCQPFLEKALGRVKKVVLMTAEGVQFSDQIPMRRVELMVERSGVPYTHLRPGWFMDNFHTFWVGAIRAQGVIPLPAADGKSAFVDARDIGACGAAALYRDDTSGKAYMVSGPQALSYAEAAEVLSQAAGRPIRYVPIDDAAFIEGSVGAGIQREYAQLLVGLFQGVRAGMAAPVTDTVQQLTGKPPRTLESYAREHAAHWKA